MAVRFDAETDSYTRTLSLGSQSAFTWCSWVRIVVDRNDFSHFSRVSEPADANTIYLGTQGDGTTLNVYYFSPVGVGPSMTVGTWYFVAVTWSATQGVLYWRTPDTTLSSASWSLSSSFNVDLLEIGSNEFGEWANHRQTAFKFWTATLTSDELLNESQQMTPLRQAALAAWYPMMGTELSDYSGNGRTLTAGSTATTVEDGPPIPWRVTSPRVILPASAGGPHIVAVGQVTETDSATVTARQKLKAVGQLSETETAQPITVVKRRSIGQVVESASVFSLSRLKTRIIGQPAESSTAQLTRVVKVRAVGFVTETDTVTPIVRPGVVTAVTETDTAQPVRAVKVRTVGLVTETSTIQALTARHTRVISQVAETSTLLQLTRLKQRTTGFVTETDSPFAAARVKSRSVGLVTETDLSLGVSGGAQVVPIGAVTETDTAQSIRSKRITRRPSSGVTLRPNTGITARP